MKLRVNVRSTAAVAVTCITLFVLAACGSPNTPTGVTLTMTGTGPAVGATTQLTATATFADGTTQVVTSEATWSSSDTSKATVSAGVVTGVAAGAVTISAIYKDVTGLLALTVTAGH